MMKIFKWVAIVFGVLVVIGIIGAAMGPSKPSNGSSANTSATQANPTATKAPEAMATLNEPVQDGDLNFTVLGVRKTKTLGNQYLTKNAQGMFYVVTLKIENKGSKTVTFDSSMAKVTSGEKEYDRSIDGQSGLGLSSGKVDLFLQQIQPDLNLTGDVVFDLPTTIENPVLVLKGGFFNKGAKVKLQ